MIDKFILATLGLLNGLIVPAAAAADDSVDLQARSLAAGCATCHPTEAAGAIPALANLSGDEMLQKLRDYQHGKTTGTVMPQIARGYTDEELQRIAAFLVAPAERFEP